MQYFYDIKGERHGGKRRKAENLLKSNLFGNLVYVTSMRMRLDGKY